MGGKKEPGWKRLEALFLPPALLISVLITPCFLHVLLQNLSGQQGCQLRDFIPGEKLQPHDFQAAIHPQFMDCMSFRVFPEKNFPYDGIGQSFPNPFRRPALNKGHGFLLSFQKKREKTNQISKKGLLQKVQETCQGETD